jgi:hypothetical protein
MRYFKEIFQIFPNDNDLFISPKRMGVQRANLIFSNLKYEKTKDTKKFYMRKEITSPCRPFRPLVL